MLSKIRPATLADLSEICAFNYDLAWHRNDFIKMIDNELYYFKVVECSGVVIAFLTAQISLDFIDVLQVCVAPGYRKQGYASQLFEDLISYSQRKTLFLDVNIHNDDAIKLYLKKGFKEISRRKKYYNFKDDALVMKREVVM